MVKLVYAPLSISTATYNQIKKRGGPLRTNKRAKHLAVALRIFIACAIAMNGVMMPFLASPAKANTVGDDFSGILTDPLKLGKASDNILQAVERMQMMLDQVAAIATTLVYGCGGNQNGQTQSSSQPATTSAQVATGGGCATVLACAQQAVQAALTAQQAAQATDAKIKALSDRLDQRGEVAAFAATSCPSPWVAYTPAAGRFIRGFDPQGTNDPDGTSRTIESIQLDSVGPHLHTMGVNGMDDNANVNQDRFPNFGNNGGVGAKHQTDNNSGVETRPKNVALLYCILK
jgi:hypothetical protein